MNPVLGPLTCTWEAQVRLLMLGCGIAQPWTSQPFEGQQMKALYLCLSPSHSVIAFQMNIIKKKNEYAQAVLCLQRLVLASQHKSRMPTSAFSEDVSYMWFQKHFCTKIKVFNFIFHELLKVPFCVTTLNGSCPWMGLWCDLGGYQDMHRKSWMNLLTCGFGSGQPQPLYLVGRWTSGWMNCAFQIKNL